MFIINQNISKTYLLYIQTTVRSKLHLQRLLGFKRESTRMRTLHVPQRILGMLPIKPIFDVEMTWCIYRHAEFVIT